MLNKRIVLTLLLSLLAMCGCENNKKNGSIKVVAEETAVTSDVTSDAEGNISPAGTETIQATEEKKDKKDKNEKDDQIRDHFVNNVCIIGDSIALGYGAYQRVPADHVFAELNVAPSTVRKFKFKYNGEEHTAIAALDSEMPEYIMLSMGVNEIETYTGEEFAEQYLDYVRDIRKLCPDSKIFIMALTPVTDDCEYTSNTAVNGYNDALRAAVSDEGDVNMKFVDVPEELSDDSGALRSEYSSGDGMHLTGDAYDILLDKVVSCL